MNEVFDLLVLDGHGRAARASICAWLRFAPAGARRLLRDRDGEEVLSCRLHPTLSVPTAAAAVESPAQPAPSAAAAAAAAAAATTTTTTAAATAAPAAATSAATTTATTVATLAPGLRVVVVALVARPAGVRAVEGG